MLYNGQANKVKEEILMRGLGTIINTLAIILGGGLGMVIKGGIPERAKTTLIQACGLAVLFIGIGGALEQMISIDGDGIAVSGTILVVCSLAIGSVIGELINIEGKLEIFGEKLKKLAHAEGDNRFVEGFVTASLIVCVGAMAVMGAISDGLTGDYSTLLTKSILDAIIAMIFASSLGLGVVFSSVSILLYQGLITLLAVFIAPYLTDAMISGLCMVGNILIFAVGINLLWEKKIKVANMLPSIFVPVVYEIIMNFFR